MNRFEIIQKKVAIPYPLKYYFAPASDEFGRIDVSAKIEMLRMVVHSGFSTYDLSEKFRGDRAKYYSEEDMHEVLRYYICKLVSNSNSNPYVRKYYENESCASVAEDLDMFLKTPVSEESFMVLFYDRFDLS